MESIIIVPVSMGSMLASALKNVVFPVPLGATMQEIVLFSNSNDKFFINFSLPILIDKLLTSTNFILIKNTPFLIYSTYYILAHNTTNVIYNLYIKYTNVIKLYVYYKLYIKEL